MSLPLEPIPADAGAHQDPADSPLERLRLIREQLAAETSREWDIPGYHGALTVRYRRLDLDEFNQAITAPAARDIERECQFLIDACEEITVLDDNGDVFARFDDWTALEPHLGIECARAREVVLAVFAGNEHALVQHSDAVARWMRTVNDAADDAFAGGP